MKTTVQPIIERRFTPGNVELRDNGAGKPKTIRGYAALYESRSENLGGFVEVIQRGAFDSVTSDDVRALFNHDANLILGRSKSGTLRIGTDERGLWYEVDADENQTYVRDLMIAMSRGDVDQSSFAFSVQREGQKWDESSGQTVRTITKVARLYDVSPVTYPAYADTEASARSAVLAEYRAAQQERRGDAPAYNDADVDYATDALEDLQDMADDCAVVGQSGANAELKAIAATLSKAVVAAREKVIAWCAANDIDTDCGDDDDEMNSADFDAERRARELALAEAEE